MIGSDVTRDVRAVLERRIRTVAISPQVLVAMCKQGNHIDATCIEGLPADAELYVAEYDFNRQLVLLHATSMTFEPCPTGQDYPEQTVTFWSEGR
jgi:hypothetical protein